MSIHESEQAVRIEEKHFAEDYPMLEIPIYPPADGSSFHTRNDPSDLYQRGTITQRKGRVNVRCEHKGIIHGYSSLDNNDLCSLIVMKFCFDPNRSGIITRIKEVHATIKFSAGEEGGANPVVLSMYPNGSFIVEPRQQHEQLVKGVGANISGGTAGAQLGADLKLEKTIDRDTTSSTKVRGSIELLRDYGKDNAVSWNLFEDAVTKTGVVSSLQGAILLKRASMATFKASVTIDVTADTATRINGWFGKDEKDDDIWYDPRKPATNILRQYSADTLGDVDLESVSDVTLHTVLERTVKKQ